MADFQKALQEEVARLEKQHAELLSQKSEIDDKLKAVEIELKAIDAYRNRKEEPKVRKPRTPRKESLKQAVMNMLATAGSATRSQLIELMQAKEDKAKQQAISNALTQLKKAGTLVSNDGVYSKA